MNYCDSLEELMQIKARMGRAVELRARLPAWPFASPHGKVDFIDFGTLMSGHFARVLAALVSHHEDDELYFMALEVDGDDYVSARPPWPAFRLAPEEIESKYWDLLSQEYDAGWGRLIDSVDRAVLVGTSGEWAVWGDRYWDIAVLLSTAKERPWQDVGVTFMTAAQAALDFAAPLDADRRSSDELQEEANERAVFVTEFDRRNF